MPRLHILGASGSGTSTLGREVAARLGCRQLETDDFLWLPDDPPYRRLRPMPDRLLLMQAALLGNSSWVISGALTGWGNVLVPRLDLVIFLDLDPGLRMARLRAREAARWGGRIAPGGDMAEGHEAFMEWAEAYDSAGPDQRSRALHEEWLAGLPCPVLRLDSAAPVTALADAVLACLTATDGPARLPAPPGAACRAPG
jgi:adenylate kinase family enzyme